MSFILDALRKSEHERQRQSGPSIAELPAGRAMRESPTMMLAVIALIALNLGVLAFFLLRSGGEENTAATLPALASPVIGEAAPIAPAPAAVADPGPAPDHGPVAELPLNEVALAPVAVAPAPAAPDPSLLPTAAPQPSVTRDPQYVPNINSLPAQVTAGLPPLSVDLHIYMDDPARRAVFINGRRYLAGNTLTEGPVIEGISREGVVLTYRGQRFLLPRQ